MPTLIETFIDYEPDLLAMIAEGWGIDQQLDPAKNTAKQIAAFLQDEALFAEILQALPRPAFSALLRLARGGGRLPVDQFEREFGILREMGAARREKLRPDRSPASVSERLFYKGLIARAFLREGGEPREYFYLPDEFQDRLAREMESASVPVLPVHKPITIQTSEDALLEHACTLLAALRIGKSTESLAFENPAIPARFLTRLLQDAGLLDAGGQPEPRQVGAFLEAPRMEAFARLVNAWQASAAIDELAWLCGLEIEGQLKRNPQEARARLLSILRQLSAESWLDMDEFAEWVKSYQPDFLRSGGEYDAWIIKDPASGQYLKGFEFWERVEGAYLRALFHGPFFWMGLVDVGMKARAKKAGLFRLSAWAADLLAGKPVDGAQPDIKTFTLEKDGSLLVERGFPLDARYQIARFSEWKAPRKGRYCYQISHPALKNALAQGLQVHQLLALIQKYGRKPLPPNIPAALERWKQHELEAVFERPVLLRVRSAAILDQLLASNAKTHIFTRLNETTAVVKPEAVGPLRQALLEMGILADARLEV